MKKMQMQMQMKLAQISLAVGMALVAAPAFAIYQHGGFEQNSFASWTIGGGGNPGLAGAEPFTGASIVINGTTPGPASVIGAQVDPRAPMLMLPRLGQYTAQLNDESGGAAITTIAQTDVLTSADIDPADNLPHLRFSFAPVLEDPSHSANQQPYFYVRVRNTTDNVLLFEQFAYSGQAGVQFQNGTANWKYLPFQTVDTTLPASAISKNIETYLVAADCSLGAHGGYVYLDAFGSAAVPPVQISNPRLPAPMLSLTMSSLLALLFVGVGLSQAGVFNRRS
jgi:hypothetical protein